MVSLPGSDDLVSWTRQQFDTQWEVIGDFPLELGLAMRRNPRRAQLLVTPALAKHVPIAPDVMRSATRELADRIRPDVGRAARPICLGMAETATGLALAVAHELDTDVMHSTRSACRDGEARFFFSERHSHAPSHWLALREPDWLNDRDLVVIVDDELSTGDTIRELIGVLKGFNSSARYVVATLVDARQGTDELDVRALVSLRFSPPPDAIDVAKRWADLMGPPSTPELGRRRSSRAITVPRPTALPSRGLRAGDRHLHDLARCIGEQFRALRAGTRDLHVLGMEEQIYLPVLVAEQLTAQGKATTVSSTTRSPIVVVDEPGYPVRSRVHYEAADGSRFAYNLPARSTVLVVPDFDTPRVEVDSLLAAIENRAVSVLWS